MKTAQRRSLALRTVYAVCLLVAGARHATTLMMNGLGWDYGGAPIGSQIYWSSLSVLDPLAAVVLFWKPRIGIMLLVAIIGSNVAHNSWLMSRGPDPDWFHPVQLAQVGFLLFVVVTARYAWVPKSTEPNNALQATCEDARA